MSVLASVDVSTRRSTKPRHHPNIRTWLTLDTIYVQAKCYQCRWRGQLKTTHAAPLPLLKSRALAEWMKHPC